jgi:hypothetical protein
MSTNFACEKRQNCFRKGRYLLDKRKACLCRRVTSHSALRLRLQASDSSHVRRKPFETHSGEEDGFVLEEDEELIADDDNDNSGSSRLPGMWKLSLSVCVVKHFIYLWRSSIVVR